MDPLTLLSAIYKNRYVIAIAGVAFLLLSFYAYYVHSTARIESLERDNKELSRVIAEQQREIEAIRVNYEQIVKAKDELSAAVEEIKLKQRTEEEKLYRERKKKKSLEELAIKKSKLVENAVNKATARVFHCFETLSEGGDC